MNLKRFTLALRLSLEALDIFQKRGDIRGEARTHSLLGDIFRDGKAPGMPDYMKAIEHYKTAAKNYENLKEPKWEGYNLYSIAFVEAYQDKSKEACGTLKISKKAYQSSPDFDKPTERFEKAGEFNFSWILTFQRKLACKQLYHLD